MSVSHPAAVPPSSSRYYKSPLLDGIEALQVSHYNTSFPFHFHPTYNISLVYEGCFHTQLQDKALIAPSGSLLITNPQEIHANPFEKQGMASFFTFYVQPSFLNYGNQHQPVIFQQKVVTDHRLFAALHKLAGSIDQHGGSPFWEKELKLAMQELALRYGSHSYDAVPQKHEDLFAELISTENYDKFSLSDAARQFGIDKYKFIRLFKFQTGLTPNNYFIFKRIEKSKAMLAERNELLSVAVDLGFYDTAHFCKYFKKFTGISPMAYLEHR